METYKTVRGFFNGGRETLETGLSLAEARRHCKNPETSSRTCTDPKLVEMTQERGQWFDGYEEE